MPKDTDAVYNGIYSKFMNNPAQNNKHNAYSIYYRTLTELALQRFTWVGLPETVDERFIELTLHGRGLVIWIKDEFSGRNLALRGTGAGLINMYDNPTRYTTLGPGYPTKSFTPSECVPIWANRMRTPETDIVQYYARRLAEFDRTVDINALQQRKPYIVSASPNERLTAQNMFKAVADGDFAVYTSDTLDVNSMIQPFNTSIHPDLVLNGILAKKKIWDECMTMLGIMNANQEKKERLVSDEVAANDEQVQGIRNTALRERQFGANQVNRMFRLKIKVEFNSFHESQTTLPGDEE